MKRFALIVCLISLTAFVASAVDAYSVRDVRNPKVLAQRLSDDFTSVVSTSDAARVTALEATSVTNATLTLSPAAITATAAVTRQVYTPTFILADGTTNATPIMTNATVAVTVVNGGVVMTNVVITLQRN